MGACAGVNGDARVSRGSWAERASWACWAAALGEELGPRGVQLGQGFGLGFQGKVGLGLVFLFYSISFLFSISNSNKV